MSVSLTSNFFAHARGITFSDGGGITWSFNANTNTLIATGSSGAVLSSVGFADLSTTPIYTVTNSPLTANGTLDITLKTQAANAVFAGPTTGAAAQPTFRSLVVADLPTGIPNANLQNSSLTVTAGTGLSGGGAVSLGGSVTLSLTNPVAVNLGGTGLASYTVGDILYASAATTLSKLADVAAGSYLRSGGVATAPVWSTITIPNAAVLGDIWYGSAASVISALAGTTSATKQFLTQTGTGSVSAAPAWGTIAAGDLPANGANPTAKVALAAVNGSATTWMRSDAAPALDVTISPTWTGNHTFTPGSGKAITVNAVAGSTGLTVSAASGTNAIQCGASGNAIGIGTGVGLSGTGDNVYSQSGNVLAIGTTGAAAVNFYTNSALRIAIASTGGVAVQAPTSGDALTTTNVAGANALVVTGNAAGTAVIRLNTQATTGAQTATFTATNKPGSGTTAPTKWVPLNIDGTTMYFPLWL